MICKKLIIPMIYTIVYIHPKKDINYLKKHKVKLNLSYLVSIEHKSPMFPYIRPIETTHITYSFYKNIT